MQIIIKRISFFASKVRINVLYFFAKSKEICTRLYTSVELHLMEVFLKSQHAIVLYI